MTSLKPVCRSNDLGHLGHNQALLIEVFSQIGDLSVTGSKISVLKHLDEE